MEYPAAHLLVPSLLSQVALGPTDELAAGGPKVRVALAREQVGEPEQSLVPGGFLSSYHSRQGNQSIEKKGA